MFVCWGGRKKICIQVFPFFSKIRQTSFFQRFRWSFLRSKINCTKNYIWTRKIKLKIADGFKSKKKRTSIFFRFLWLIFSNIILKTRSAVLLIRVFDFVVWVTSLKWGLEIKDAWLSENSDTLIIIIDECMGVQHLHNNSFNQGM